jgi:hypothetical protein
MARFVLLSNINNYIKIIYEGADIHTLIDKMKEKAVQYICDNVGKNNYVETLDSNEYKDAPLEKYPRGFILKWAKNTDYIRQIDIYFNHELKGYIYGKYKDSEYKGFFAIIPCTDFDQEAISSSGGLKGPTKAQSQYEVSGQSRSNYSALISELNDRFNAHKAACEIPEAPPAPPIGIGADKGHLWAEAADKAHLWSEGGQIDGQVPGEHQAFNKKIYIRYPPANDCNSRAESVYSTEDES